jgi:hypothetical protein
MIRIFDIETTGIDAKEDRIIEIAAYDLNPFDGSIAPAGDRLCNPNRAIPPGASAVHHLIDADVAAFPPFGQVWSEFSSPEITVYAAHNCEFEASFLPTPAGVDWTRPLIITRRSDTGAGSIAARRLTAISPRWRTAPVPTPMLRRICCSNSCRSPPSRN